MDGIAVRAADFAAVPVRLGADRFVDIDTGDPLSPPHDAVVMRERLHRLPCGAVELRDPVAPGQHVRGVGEDVRAGEFLLPPGHRIRPVDAAALAGAGRGAVTVAARPVVAVVPTGDEVRPPGSPLGRGEITDTNSLMLAATVREHGGVAQVTEIVPDDPARLARTLRSTAARGDLVVVIAGSSKGRDDHTVAVLAELGAVHVHGLPIRPGHPVALGVLRQGGRAVPVIGVPGYPVSAAHVFASFGVPVVLRLQGARPEVEQQLPAVLAEEMTSPSDVDEAVLVRLEPDAAGGVRRAFRIGRGASALSALMRADGVLRIPSATTYLPAGSPVVVRSLAGAPVAGI